MRFLQQVFGLQGDLTTTRGRHLLKMGGLFERYLQDMVNPTFSLGTYSFANLRAFLENRATSFIGLTPEGQFDRYWRFWIVGGYLQDELRVSRSADAQRRPALRNDDAASRHQRPRLGARQPHRSHRRRPGSSTRSPTRTTCHRASALAWDPTGDGMTSVRGGYGMYFNTNSSQNLIVTVTNPPATPRVVFPNPTFPNPPFDRTSGLSVRPVQWDIETPQVQVWNVNVQRELFGQTALTVGYAGSRGRHLLRSNDVNTAAPITGSDGLPFFPAGAPRINTAWTTIELKSSDGDSWYRALIVEARRRWSNGFMFQSVVHVVEVGGHDAGVDVLLGRDQRHDLGVSRVHSRTTTRDSRTSTPRTTGCSTSATTCRSASIVTGVSGALARGWRLSGIVNVRSGNPLTVFVQNNRSRSQWQPSLGPGIGRDRASYAPGFGADNAVAGDPNAWFNPAAFALSAAGTFGNTGRGDFIGPNLRTVDLSARQGHDRSAPSAPAAGSRSASRSSISSIAPTSARRS